MTEDTIIGIYQGLVNRHKPGRSGPPACWDCISSQSVARTDSHGAQQLQLVFSFCFATYRLSPAIIPKVVRVSLDAHVNKLTLTSSRP